MRYDIFHTPTIHYNITSPRPTPCSILCTILQYFIFPPHNAVVRCIIMFSRPTRNCTVLSMKFGALHYLLHWIGMIGPTNGKTRPNQTTPCLYLKCICICVCAVEWPDRQTCSQDKTDQIHPHLRSLWTCICICICDKSFFCIRICICICICAACSGMTGQTRQTKSSPTLDLSAFPGISIIARLPTQKTSIFRVFNINASTVCQNPIAFCLPEVISNRALVLEKWKNWNQNKN